MCIVIIYKCSQYNVYMYISNIYVSLCEYIYAYMLSLFSYIYDCENDCYMETALFTQMTVVWRMVQRKDSILLMLFIRDLRHFISWIILYSQYFLS